MSAIFDKALGIEINDGYICMGWRKSKKLLDFTRVDAPVADGLILDPPMLKGIIRDYVTAHRTGRSAMLTIKTSRAILRITGLPERRKTRLDRFRKPPEINAGDIFPIDTTGYAVDYRPLGGGSALVCCMPGEISDSFAGLIADIGLVPIRISVYADSISAAMERTGKNAACVTDGYLIYVENGVLKELLPGYRAEAEVLLHGTVLDHVYALAGNDRCVGMFSGIAAERADELAVRGLLGIT